MIGIVQYLISTGLLITYSYMSSDATPLFLFIVFYLITNLVFKTFGIVPKELNQFYTGFSTTLADSVNLIKTKIIVPATKFVVKLLNKVIDFHRSLFLTPIVTYYNSFYNIGIWLTDGTAIDYFTIFVLNCISFFIFQLQTLLNNAVRFGFKLIGLGYSAIKVVDFPDTAFIFSNLKF